MDGGDPEDIVHLDFQRLSTKTPEQRLLNKCSSYGIRRKVLSQAGNWLKGGRELRGGGIKGQDWQVEETGGLRTVGCLKGLQSNLCF